MTMTIYRKIIREALDLARAGEEQRGVALLESALHDPSLAADPKWLSRLARNAGILSEHEGDLDKAYKYYRQALRFQKNDPATLYALGEV